MKKKSYAKVNIFLKIVGRRDNYHLLASRFVMIKDLFDIVEFQKGIFDKFIIEGQFGCSIEQNTIFKAYKELCKISSDVEKFFKNYKVVVEKNIPYFAGLGGGSSNAATFILMVNRYCNLKLSKDTMAKIGLKIGADVPFFIYEYNSANVSGVGEVVKQFDEDELNLTITTPKVVCDTSRIFTLFREKYYKEASFDEVEKLFSMKSKDILKSYSKEYLNDLYLPATVLNKELVLPQNSFFSGSGSSFFILVSELK